MVRDIASWKEYLIKFLHQNTLWTLKNISYKLTWNKPKWENINWRRFHSSCLKMNQFSLRRKEQNLTDLIFRKFCVLMRIDSHQDLKSQTQHSRHDRHPTRHQMGKVEASRYVPVLTCHNGEGSSFMLRSHLDVPSNGEDSNFVSRSQLDILSNREDKSFLSWSRLGEWLSW